MLGINSLITSLFTIVVYIFVLCIFYVNSNVFLSLSLLFLDEPPLLSLPTRPFAMPMRWPFRSAGVSSPSSLPSFFCVCCLLFFFVPSSLCNYFRNDDNGSALEYNLLRSVVVCIVAARHSGWAKQNMSGVFYYFPHYVFPSIRLCCPFAHSWVEPRVEQTLHVAFIIVETRLTFHQLLVAFISRFKLTLSPCNFIWPHFLVCKWGLESRYVFLSPFLCVEFFLSLVVAVSVPIYCNVRVPLCPPENPLCFFVSCIYSCAAAR